jgi:hypothetical protein
MSNFIPEYCPSCGQSFTGDPIQEKDRPLFGGEKNFSLCIGIYSLTNDAVTIWRCPFCDYEWARLFRKAANAKKTKPYP